VHSARNTPRPRGRRSCEGDDGPGPGPSKEPGRPELIGAPRRIKTRDQLGRALLRAARRRARRLEPRAPPPVCGPAFGSCSGGASGGDAWASASDTVNTVTSAGAAARLNAASPRRESALRREITSDVLISNLPDYEVDEAQPSLSGRRRRSIALSRLPPCALGAYIRRPEEDIAIRSAAISRHFERDPGARSKLNELAVGQSRSSLFASTSTLVRSVITSNGPSRVGAPEANATTRPVTVSTNATSRDASCASLSGALLGLIAG
jgi:hypothetical protein